MEFDSDQPNTVSSYVNYPNTKPFVNTDWAPSYVQQVPVQYQPASKAFPESNRDLIMSTLKKLQKKLNKMELDKSLNVVTYNQNNNNSASSSSRHDPGIHSRSKTPSQDSVYSAYPVPIISGHNNQSIGFDLSATVAQSKGNDNQINCETEKRTEEKIANTEKRVLELEKQLQKMRKLLGESTVNKGRQLNNNHDIDSDTTLGDAEVLSSFGEEHRSSFKRNPKTKEKKKVRQSRKVCYQEPKQIKSRAITPVSRAITPVSRAITPVSRAITPVSRASRSCSAETSHQHYRLNLEKLPFCVGQATTPSHNLGCNIQNVISLLKQHHPKLCANLPSNCDCSKNNHTHREKSRTAPETQIKQRSTSNPGTKVSNKAFIISSKPDTEQAPRKRDQTPKQLSKNCLSNKINSKALNISVDPGYNGEWLSNHENDSFSSLNFDCNELLRILQEEYTKLVLHHYDLTKKILNTQEGGKRLEYELKAEYLSNKMKAKGKQISNVKMLQQQKSTSKHDLNKAWQVEEELENDFCHNKTKYKVKDFKQKTSNRPSGINHRLHQSTSSTSLFNPEVSSISGSTGGFKTLQLFKDIKNLQMKIQNDLDY